MESTRNAREWNNPEAGLTAGQRVRGMARASVAEAIGDKFGILGQRASDKIKGKTGPSIGQMAKAAGKEAYCREVWSSRQDSYDRAKAIRKKLLQK